MEKTAESARQFREVGAPRIESLQELSETYNADPYELSKRVRKQFREVKKVEKRKREEEDSIKNKYSLPASLKLVDESEVKEEANATWTQERTQWEAEERAKRRKTAAELGFGTKKNDGLASALLRNSLKGGDPFLSSKSASSSKPTITGIIRKPKA